MTVGKRAFFMRGFYIRRLGQVLKVLGVLKVLEVLE
jgi:hypothetical protein